MTTSHTTDISLIDRIRGRHFVRGIIVILPIVRVSERELCLYVTQAFALAFDVHLRDLRTNDTTRQGLPAQCTTTSLGISGEQGIDEPPTLSLGKDFSLDNPDFNCRCSSCTILSTLLHLSSVRFDRSRSNNLHGTSTLSGLLFVGPSHFSQAPSYFHPPDIILDSFTPHSPSVQQLPIALSPSFYCIPFCGSKPRGREIGRKQSDCLYISRSFEPFLHD